jgi:hypothetical protein
MQTDQIRTIDIIDIVFFLYISIQIRIRIRIVSTMSDEIWLDIDIINMQFEYSGYIYNIGCWISKLGYGQIWTSLNGFGLEYGRKISIPFSPLDAFDVAFDVRQKTTRPLLTTMLEDKSAHTCMIIYFKTNKLLMIKVSRLQYRCSAPQVVKYACMMHGV